MCIAMEHTTCCAVFSTSCSLDIEYVSFWGNSSYRASVRAERSRWWAARASPTTAPLCAHPFAPNRSKKLTLTQRCDRSPRDHDRAPPCRLSDRALHHASAPPGGISTVPERSSPSSSLSTTPLARCDLLEHVDSSRSSPPNLSWPSPLERIALHQ
jgi:hypothetical protein